MRTRFIAPLFVALVIFILSACNKNDGASINNIVITSITPNHGIAGMRDTIVGRNFDKIPILDSVLINGARVKVITRTAELIIIEIPHSSTGPVDVWYDGKMIRGPIFNYDSTLVVTTLAGSSTEPGAIDAQGFNARFNTLQGIAVDNSGNVYVADNNAIRKITPTGNVTTLAGSIHHNGGYVDGTGSAARFGEPHGLALGSDGFLYVGEYNNMRVRKVSLAGVVTTFAGITWDNLGPTGGQTDGPVSIATFNTPRGLAMDAQNNVYVADIRNNRIRKITQGGMVSSLTSSGYYNYGFQDGPHTSSLFFTPYSVASAADGTLYVYDMGNHRLRKITPDGVASTLFGPIEGGQSFESYALGMDLQGNLYFSQAYGIMKRTPAGVVTPHAVGGIGEIDGPAQIATFRGIKGIAVGNDGTMYITDNYRVRKLAWQ